MVTETIIMDLFSHSFGQSTYHFIWCTKYRYKTLRSEYVKSLCAIFIRETAKRHGIRIRELVVDDDHVHTEADVPPSMSVSRAFQLLKGTTSYLLFKAFPNFRKRYPKGHFWSIGKIFRSVSDVQQDAVEKYIRNHRSYVQTSLAGYSGL
jgi:putative transposase